MESILKNNRDVFNFIVLRNNTDVNVKDVDEKTALELALLKQRDLDMSEKLVVERKAELNFTDTIKGKNFMIIMH